MGGSLNHEFLAVSSAGEDSILVCSKYEKHQRESRLSVKENFVIFYRKCFLKEFQRVDKIKILF
jgi:hypothetical protein